MDKKLFLIDAFAMIFRGYYAFIKNPRINSKGLNTSAVFGFTNSLLDLIKREKPTHLAVVFDMPGKTFRHDDYAEYKANRNETPDAIVIAVPYIKSILEAMRIPVLGVVGFEADDVIGTLAKKAEKEGFQTFMVTPDKDFAQLVSPNIFLYKPSSRGNEIEILGEEEVKTKYEIKDPLQMIDYLAMMGDSVDNIPGLQGVGEKTAKKFLQEYDSIENLLANTDKISGKIKEKIEASAEMGLLSKKLATINIDVPLPFHHEDCVMETPDFQKVHGIFEELEFKRMLENIEKIYNPNLVSAPKPISEKQNSASQTLGLFDELPQSNYVSSKSSAKDRDTLYQTLEDLKIIKMLFKNLNQQKNVAFSIELSNENDLMADVLGISFCYKSGLTYYLPYYKLQEQTECLELLKDFFANESICKIGFNIKPSLKILKQKGIPLNGLFFDTQIAHYLLHADAKHTWDYVCESQLNFRPLEKDTEFGKAIKNLDVFQNADADLQSNYLGEMADLNLELYELLHLKLKENELQDLFFSVEMPLLLVLAQMEINGILLDKNQLAKESLELEKDLAVLESKISALANAPININSPKQLGELLFDQLKLDAKAKKTKTGQYATSEDVLQKLAPKHEVIQWILEHRQLQKLKSTYVDALPLQVAENTQRIHTTFAQSVAATGRLSSINPNLQNIPIRNIRGQQVRAAFISPKNSQLLSADYSQIELRLIAEISGDLQMQEAFIKGQDIHAATAAKLFNIPLEEVSKTQRSQAKTVNFGIIYGVSAFGLSEQTGLSRSEAKQMIDAYFETYPQLKNYMTEMVETAREQGYVSTVLKRKRYLPDLQSGNAVVRSHAERNAVNTPIQGSAADIIKLAMIKIDAQLREQNLETKMLLQVHDELVFEVPQNEIDAVKTLIKTEMERAFPTKVPLLVEIGMADNWLAAH